MPPVPDRLYLKLLHGRTAADADMEDWGTEGPYIGPFDWMHVTYMATFRLGNDLTNVETELPVHEDLVCVRGVFYGDWEVVRSDVPPPNCEIVDLSEIAQADTAIPPPNAVSRARGLAREWLRLYDDAVDTDNADDRDNVAHELATLLVGDVSEAESDGRGS